MRQIWRESRDGERTISPNLRSDAGFWGARQEYRATWSKEICDTVRVLGSDEPHTFRTAENIDRVLDAIKVGLCSLHDDLSKSEHRIYDDRAFGRPVCTAVLLTERGKELLQQLASAA